MPVHVLKRLVDDFDATLGETECIHILYQNQPISRILSKILPLNEDDEDGMQQSPPSSYEQIGHVAHVNLRKPHVRYGKIIGRVMLDRLRPSIRTVVNKLGEVGGPYRTYEMDLLAGDDDYLVRVVEHGVSLDFDLRKVYWCTRLEGDRTHMMQNEFRPNQLIADAFCGVGALCIRAATALGCAVVANDLNPDAVAYCRESARLNGIRVGENIDDGRFHVQCGDAREFIMNLGIGVSAAEPSLSSASSIEEGEDDSDDVFVPPINGNNLPDHLLLNFPLDSPKFLNALRWWPSGCDKIKSTPTRVHVYTFSRADDERTASDVAIDMVADGLLPEGGYVEPSKFRGGYLDELGCNVQAREVRDAAPGKAVICVSFGVTRLLLRRMQGDYGLVIRD
jgi:tRNA (guanine37-N1)-methyltransferase